MIIFKPFKADLALAQKLLEDDKYFYTFIKQKK